MVPQPKRFKRDDQTGRFGPVFQRLRSTLESKEAIVASRDPTALLPESLLVFEVTAPLSNLAAALFKIPSLNLIAEELAETIDEGDDEAGFLYLMFPDHAALEMLLSLWEKWRTGEEIRGWAGVRDLFECLKDIRRWSAQDRVRDSEAKALEQIAKSTQDRMIGVEIELVFHEESVRGEIAEALITEAVKKRGGKVLHAARRPEFASHAMLVSLNAEEVFRIAERQEDSLAGLDPIFSIGPQCQLAPESGPEPGDPAALQATIPEKQPIAAILDAVPDLAHPYLVDRFVFDDPDNLDALSLGERYHGTAMASLVMHGDLNVQSPTLQRPIYIRPLMYALSGQQREVFPPDRLVVETFYDAVVRMKGGLNGRAPVAPSVIIVNVSLGDNRRRFAGRLSRWARAIDDLSWRYGLLFMVSAGNLDIPTLDDLPIESFKTLKDFAGASCADRGDAILSGLAKSIRNRTLLAPADSVNALTIGAAHLDNCAPAAVSMTSDYGAYQGFPVLSNPSSAPGPGFNRAIKPDVLFAGGREKVAPVAGETYISVRPRGATKAAGLKVAGHSPVPLPPAHPGRTTFAGQTSAATALATRTAHRIHDALESSYGEVFHGLPPRQRALILKALVVHRAKWSDATAHINKAFPESGWQTQRANAARLLGYGIVDPEEAVTCAVNRATAWGAGQLAVNMAAVFRLPLPPSLAEQAVPHAVSVTVVWFTPTAPGRRSYRQVRISLPALPPDDLGRLGLGKQRGQPDLNATRRGTVAHQRYTGGHAAALLTNDALEIKIERMPDLGVGVEDKVEFAVAVTIEADADLPIYDEVAVRLQVRPAVQVLPVSTLIEI